ncbi:MAG: helix-turn-helix domain-containing protein, partial [Rhodobacteraceae bacterium]|nr:helix-turn-helix domain-containing protein [Paracoccaceae bacterium]
MVQGIRRQTLEFDGRRPVGFTSIMFSETQRFEFDGGTGRLLTEQLSLGESGIRVSRVRSTGHRIRLDENRDVTFLFPRSGSLSVRVSNRDARIAAGDASFLRPHMRETHARSAGVQAFQGHVLMLPLSEICKIAETSQARPFLGTDVLPVRGSAARRLSDYLDFLLSSLDHPRNPAPSERVIAGMAALVQDLIADWLGEIPVEHGVEDRALGVDAARVRRAEEIMRARIDGPLSVADLAQELGLSLRSLQLAFHSVYGEGPRARLTRIRLDLARAALLAAEPPRQVTTVALDCGFTHL